MASANQKVTDPVAPVEEASVTVTDKTGVNYEFQLMQVSSRSGPENSPLLTQKAHLSKRNLRQLLKKTCCFSCVWCVSSESLLTNSVTPFEANFPQSSLQTQFSHRASRHQVHDFATLCSDKRMFAPINEWTILCTKRVETPTFLMSNYRWLLSSR